mmetsp:Transcript_81537/g.230835  ORF Transcript_81537/g.230835 Transcript_81537/m.230835 type:complete len:224 (-) Transcript_81537:35-706(-)
MWRSACGTCTFFQASMKRRHACRPACGSCLSGVKELFCLKCRWPRSIGSSSLWRSSWTQPSQSRYAWLQAEQCSRPVSWNTPLALPLPWSTWPRLQCRSTRGLRLSEWLLLWTRICFAKSWRAPSGGACSQLGPGAGLWRHHGAERPLAPTPGRMQHGPAARALHGASAGSPRLRCPRPATAARAQLWAAARLPERAPDSYRPAASLCTPERRWRRRRRGPPR